MEKIIEIDLHQEKDMIEKYNSKKLSNELLEYMIQQATAIQKNEKVKIMIHKKCDIDRDCVRLIKDGLKEAYNKSIQERHSNNVKQLLFFLVGAFFIFLSTQVKDEFIWKELLLITGWVPIWELIEVELFPDAYGRKRRKIIKKLLQTEIMETTKELEEDLLEI